MTPDHPMDREAQRVDAFLRQLRKGKHINPDDVERELRRVAESALAWVDKLKQ